MPVDVAYENRKQRNLILGIVFDCVGMLSYMIPGITEWMDVVWAPVSGLLMVWLYKGAIGKISGVVSFLEELFPFTDLLPTFTLTWIYTYYIRSDKGKFLREERH